MKDTLPEDYVPVLPEDPEAALNTLGVLEAQKLKAESNFRTASELRNRAVAEAVLRGDINTTRASIRMALSRQRLHEIKDALLKTLRTAG